MKAVVSRVRSVVVNPGVRRMNMSTLISLAVMLFFAGTSIAQADCWRLPNGQVVMGNGNTAPAVYGASRVTCPGGQPAQTPHGNQFAPSAPNSPANMGAPGAAQTYGVGVPNSAQQCWLLPNGQRIAMMAGSSPPMSGARIAPCSGAPNVASGPGNMISQPGAPGSSSNQLRPTAPGFGGQAANPATTAGGQQCWVFPNGQRISAMPGSTPPVAGARYEPCTPNAAVASHNSTLQRGANKSAGAPVSLSSPPLRGPIHVNQAFEAYDDLKNSDGTRMRNRDGKEIFVGYHTGVDLRAALDTEVLAVRGGTVDYLPMGVSGHPTNHGMGHVAILKADDGFYYLYAHLNSSLKTGPVKAGDPIAKSGQSGGSWPPHLHLEKKTKPVLGDSSGMNVWGYTRYEKNQSDSVKPRNIGYANPL